MDAKRRDLERNSYVGDKGMQIEVVNNQVLAVDSIRIYPNSDKMYNESYK